MVRSMVEGLTVEEEKCGGVTGVKEECVGLLEWRSRVECLLEWRSRVGGLTVEEEYGGRAYCIGGVG